jgi:hypothetical protein
MRRLPEAERTALWLWLIVAAVVWNGLYDILLTRGVDEFLVRAALYQAGRMPEPSMSHMMDITVRNAIWISTVWSGMILLAGLVTIRLLRGGQRFAFRFDPPASD